MQQWSKEDSTEAMVLIQEQLFNEQREATGTYLTQNSQGRSPKATAFPL